MTEEKQGEVASVPPAGGPYVPPPESVAQPPNPATPPVQQPKVEIPPTQTRVQTPPPPPPVAKVETPPSTPPASTPPADSGTTGLLGNLETLKPTLASLKIPEGVQYDQEFLSGIVSTSSTLDEAQKRFDTAHSLVVKMQQGLVAKNSEWISNLKQDPEVGKANWEASLDLYRKGVVEEFGKEFAESLAKGKLDAEPNFFKAVVRRMRAKTPKPVVQGEPPAPASEAPKTTEGFAKQVYSGMATGYSKVPVKKGPTW